MSEPRVTHVRCFTFTCNFSIQVSVSPISVYVPGEGLQLLPPRLAAPFICEMCRQEPVKLKAARTEMFRYIGPEQTQEKFDG